MSARAAGWGAPAGPVGPAWRGWRRPVGPVGQGPGPPRRRSPSGRTDRPGSGCGAALERPAAAAAPTPATRPGSSAPPPHHYVRADGAAAAGVELEVEVGWAAAGVAACADSGQQLAGLHPLAEVDQVVVVVGVVVGGATPVAQPQADPPRPRSVLLRRVMVPLVTATRGVPAGASRSMPWWRRRPPSRGAPQPWPIRTGPLTGHAPPAALLGGVGRWQHPRRVDLAQPVDQRPQPTQLGGGQHGQDRHHHQHRQPTTRCWTTWRRPGDHGRPPSGSWTAATAAAGSKGPPVPRHSGQRR